MEWLWQSHNHHGIMHVIYWAQSPVQWFSDCLHFGKPGAHWKRLRLLLPCELIGLGCGLSFGIFKRSASTRRCRGKESTWIQCRRRGFNPRARKVPGGGNGNPLQYSCLENPMDRGDWWPTVHGGHKEWDMTVTECTHTHTHAQFYTLRKNTVQKDTCTPVFTAVLFTVARICK